MEVKVFGYVRDSSTDQNFGRQLDALLGIGVEQSNIFQEKMSGGKKIDMPLNLFQGSHVLLKIC